MFRPAAKIDKPLCCIRSNGVVFFCGTDAGEVEVWGSAVKEAEVVLLVVNEGAGVGFGDEDREADRLFGVFGGIVYRPVGSPRGEKNAVREDDYTSITRRPRSTRFSWDKLHTGTETFHRFAEADVAAHIAMSG